MTPRDQQRFTTVAARIVTAIADEALAGARGQTVAEFLGRLVSRGPRP